MDLLEHAAQGQEIPVIPAQMNKAAKKSRPTSNHEISKEGPMPSNDRKRGSSRRRWLLDECHAVDAGDRRGAGPRGGHRRADRRHWKVIDTCGRSSRRRAPGRRSGRSRSPASSGPRNSTSSSPRARPSGGQDRRHAQAARLRLTRDPRKGENDGRQDREGLDHHLEGLAGRRLPGR